jgi:hypothetical protein
MKAGKTTQTVGGAAIVLGILVTIAGSQPPPIDQTHLVISMIGTFTIIGGLIVYGIGYFLRRAEDRGSSSP